MSNFTRSDLPLKGVVEKPKRGRGNPNWVKGVGSANPGGQPKASKDWIKLLRENGDKYGKQLERIAMSGNASNSEKIAAIKILLEYGFGKPQQTIQQNINHTSDLHDFISRLDGQMKVIDGTLLEDKPSEIPNQESQDGRE